MTSRLEEFKLINTLLVTCLSILIWGSYPKTNMGTDRELTIHIVYVSF